MGQQAETSDDARELRPLAPGRAERRGVWLSVLLPFMLVLITVIAIVGTILSLRSPVQVAVLADSMLTALVLCPLVLCMFPLVILSLVLVALLNRWHPRSRSPLRRLEAWTAMMEQNVEGWLGNVDERVLNWAVRMAPLRELLTTFEPPAVESSEKGSE
ncbi:MAG: hypothetical protein OXG49_02125 [Chloroflexi bacterium]|nr:hypothetical protein [Chloroflexota bacterium]